MLVIDADTHVDETEDTWEYLRDEETQFKPTTVYPRTIDPSQTPSRYWLIDGQRQIRYGGGMASAPDSLLNNSTVSRSRGNSRIAFSSSSAANGVGSSPTSFLNSA